MSVLPDPHQIVLPIVFNIYFHCSSKITPRPALAVQVVAKHCPVPAVLHQDPWKKYASLREGQRNALKVLIQPWGHKDNTTVIGSS